MRAASKAVSNTEKKIKELNHKWEIEKMPSDIPRVQQMLEPPLRNRVQCLLASSPEDVQK